MGSTAAFDILRDYSGQHFFEGWDFYGYWDNLTLGAWAYAYVLCSVADLALDFQVMFGG